MGWGACGGEAAAAGLENALVVDGIDNVYEVLEQVSMNKMPQLDYIECSACQGGCIGGMLAAENRFVALSNLQHRIRKMRENEPEDRLETMASHMQLEDFPKSADYRKKIVPRPMMQLDDDIMEAMKKFDYILEPVYGSCDYNHLCVRSAVAIILDRLAGEAWWEK